MFILLNIGEKRIPTLFLNSLYQIFMNLHFKYHITKILLKFHEINIFSLVKIGKFSHFWDKPFFLTSY